MLKKTLRRTARRALYRTKQGVRPQHPVGYATHQPVLIGLAQIRPIRRVLEFGSGLYSSKLFLNRDLFPQLEELVSYEDTAEWRDAVLEAVGDDDRFDLRLVDAVNESVPADLERFDLIFVDDSHKLKFRAQTMATVGDRRPRNPIVVVHDFEWRPYRRALMERFEHIANFDTFTPQTGVCWNGDTIDSSRMEALRAGVEALRSTDVIDNVTWARKLAQVVDPKGSNNSKP